MHKNFLKPENISNVNSINMLLGLTDPNPDLLVIGIDLLIPIMIWILIKMSWIYNEMSKMSAQLKT